MFKSIEFIKYDGQKKQYLYLLKDDDFECEVAATRAAAVVAVAPERAAAVVAAATAAAALTVLEYKKRNLSVAKNVALMYLFYKNQGYEISFLFDKNWIDKYCPELEYGKKYYNDVLDYYNKLLLLK